MVALCHEWLKCLCHTLLRAKPERSTIKGSSIIGNKFVVTIKCISGSTPAVDAGIVGKFHKK
jgi:hypothetical protein